MHQFNTGKPGCRRSLTTQCELICSFFSPQDALERLIEQLIEEYIDEIEKIAAVVTNNEEFAEEASTPFEVGMTGERLRPLFPDYCSLFFV